MENNVVSELSHLLKGEQMAIEAYEKFIRNAEDETVKSEFEKIQEDHKRHAAELSERIESLGGNPDRSTGLSGFMAQTMISTKNIGDTDPLDIIKQAFDGEDKGIAKSEEIVKGDLDQESRMLVNKILSDDHDHLKRMMEMIASYKTKN